jgi:pilus assembly protein Flp/PilA
MKYAVIVGTKPGCKLSFNGVFKPLMLRKIIRRKTEMLFIPNAEGQGLIEYALILVLVAIVVLIILFVLGPAIGQIFSNVVVSL